jgi:hypothetical protein
VLPLLYLHGLSSKDFVPAKEFLGSGAGLSASAINRLTEACAKSTSAGAPGTCPVPTSTAGRIGHERQG